ncbi:MAG: carbonic anhydrase [Turneriella sp.]|nr:carbonic anhydrase [Turneriella sp.]
MRTLTKEIQQQLTPDEALRVLMKGNQRFMQNLKANRNLLQQVNDTAEGQYPFAVILSCIDSRTSAELIFDQGLGDIFSIRIAGNVLNDDIIGSIEFATKIVGTKIVVILGHTKCGAVTGACNHVELGKLTGLLKKIKPAIDGETATRSDRTGANPAFVQNVTENHVNLVIADLRRQSPIIKDLEQQKKIKVLGGIYDVESGEVVILPD